MSPAPMSVLRVVTRLNIGGPAIHAALLSTRMDPARFTTCLVVGTPDAAEGDLGGLVRDAPQVRLIRLTTLGRPLRPWADARALARLLRLVFAQRPHIIHTHMAKAGALGRLAGLLYNRIGPGRRPGRRAVLVHTFHGHVLDGYFPAWQSQIFLRIERWLARRTDVLIAVSPAIREDLLKKGLGRAAQWRVIPLGLPLSLFADLPLPNGAPAFRIGQIGRLVPIKNCSMLLQALARWRREEPGALVQAVLVGDGPLRAALEQEASALGLAGAVRFLGWRQDLRAVYQDLDVACVTSWNEGTPVVLIEAMASARAVIATDVGGIRDLLAEGSTTDQAIAPGKFAIGPRGILVRAGDPNGLAAALRRLRDDPALRRSLGAAGRAFVTERFTEDRLLRDIEALYHEKNGDRLKSPTARGWWTAALLGLTLLLSSPFWIWSCPGTGAWQFHFYRSLIYDQVARRAGRGGTTQEDHVRRLNRYVQEHVWSTAADAPYDGKAFDYLVHGVGWCDYQAKILKALLAVQGIPARYAMLMRTPEVSTHTVSEVLSGGRWGVHDTLFGLSFTRRDGSPATLEDLSADPGLLLQQDLVAPLRQEFPDAVMLLQEAYGRVLPLSSPPRRSAPRTRDVTLFDRLLLFYARVGGPRTVAWMQDRYLRSIGLDQWTGTADLLRLARHLDLGGRPARAKVLYQVCVLDPALADQALLWLGLEQLEAEGDAAAARDTLQALILREPGSRLVPIAQYHIGRCEERLGHRVEAVAWYWRAGAQHVFAAWRRLAELSRKGAEQG